MIYYKDDSLFIRSIIESDIEDFVAGFKEQNWHKSYELFNNYYNQKLNNEIEVIVAEIEGHVVGYVTLFPNTKVGPFSDKNIPEIVDFNVLIKYQRRGVGSKIMDVTEALAKESCDYVSLSVGLHSGYGTAQRMYVKRGYVPDGTGVWYKGKQLEPYTQCENNDDLTLYFLKYLKAK
ncbi:GNAT family N-acetyltransferase [Oceanirhabdus seepicola]|uniref:GNAT family N-acetyltransferase n=1 Tax=Oceanirhabdus seepicola TaxID=2828781 RepID=A0A9J6NWT2_9CLOT|nr:GNAT family N-acetyltransferase [Oceanirhabdus seepicola]MCM1988516.1 GNAT family N-acetyltransferase [Oceanirhabdus seepicola]